MLLLQANVVTVELPPACLEWNVCIVKSNNLSAGKGQKGKRQQKVGKQKDI